MVNKQELPPEELKRQEVLAEIEAEQKRAEKFKNPEAAWLQQVMNNIVLRLPNQFHSEGSWRLAVHPKETWDTPHNKVHEQVGGAPWTSASGNTGLFLDQTSREFQKTIQDAIEKNPSVNLSRVVRLTTLYFTEPDPEKAQVTLYKLYKYLLPVYIDLRVQGYNWRDLSG